MNFMLERGRVPVPFGPGGKMQPGLLWSPRIWGRSSGNWGLFWLGSKDSTPLQEQDGQTDKAGRWWKVASERELGLMGENGSGFGVAPSVIKAGRGQSEVLERTRSFQGAAVAVPAQLGIRTENSTRGEAIHVLSCTHVLNSHRGTLGAFYFCQNLSRNSAERIDDSSRPIFSRSQN